jgi:hypothetical protein
MSTTKHKVAVVVDRSEKVRYFAHAPADAGPELWGTGDPAGRHRLYWRYAGVNGDRALELAAMNAAALCIDYMALELWPDRWQS